MRRKYNCPKVEVGIKVWFASFWMKAGGKCLSIE